MDEAVEADRVVVMEKGSIIMDDKPKAVFSKVEKLKKVGLDVPQVTELLFELRKDGIDVRQDVLTVEDCSNELIKLIKN